MSQQEEMKNLTLLGNKETPYIFEYLHKSWSLLIIVILIMITLSNSTVQNLRHFVLLLGNLILQASIFLIFQTSSALSLNL